MIAAAHADARKSITSRMWAYRGITVPINVFDFTVSRHRDGPEIFLDGFTGKLMADCYSGYDAVEIASDGRIIRAACVAHARRKVFDARSNHPAHAAVLLSMFQQLYDIEDRARTFSLADRQGLRQAEAKPIWERMREYINGDAVQDVLDRLLAGETDYHALRPDVWKESHPEAVRVYRQEERAARADAKATKRARRRGARK